MKKLISALMIACLMVSLFAFAPTASAADPVSIATWDEFYAAVTEDPFGSYKLTADVTVGPGQTIAAFYGEFDGAGHTVTVEATMFTQLGLAAYVHDFTVQSKDNAVVDFTPICLKVKDDFTDEPIVFVNVTNNVSVNTVENGADCSGFVALVEGTGAIFMLNCVNNGDIAGGNQCAGFISRTWPSEANFTLINCINNGDISSTKHHCGGLLGCMDNSSGANNITMKNCANYGNVTSTLSDAAGLIALVNGKNSVVVIENCYTEGVITHTVTDSTGEDCNTSGIIAFVASANTIDIKNCLVNVPEFKPANNNAAYVINYVKSSATLVTIENCYYVDINIGEMHTGAYELAEDGTLIGTKAAQATELSSGVTMNALNKDNAGGWVQNIGIDALPKPATLTDVEIPISPDEDEDETTAGDDVTEAPDDATQAPDDATKAPDDATQAPDDATQAPVDDATTAANGGDTADGGCASVAAVGVALVAILGTAIVFKKN